MKNIRYKIADNFLADKTLTDFITRLDEVFEADGETIFNGSRNVIKRFRLPCSEPSCQDVVVKKFGKKDVFHQFVYSFFRKSKAERAFFNGLKLMSVGCETPCPIAFVERRNCHLLDSCYYVTSYTSAISIGQFFVGDFDRPLARKFAQFMAKLHEGGIVHHDLNGSNVLVDRTDSSDVISVIDINRMTSKPPQKLTLADCKDDLVRWGSSDDSVYPFVMREYALARGFEVDDFMAIITRMKAQHDSSWQRRKRISRFFKRLVGKK